MAKWLKTIDGGYINMNYVNAIYRDGDHIVAGFCIGIAVEEVRVEGNISPIIYDDDHYVLILPTE